MPVTLDVSARSGSKPAMTVVTIGGQLEADTADSARKPLEALVAAPPAVVVFELSKLEFISSIGLGLLLDVARRLGRGGSSVYAVSARPRIAKVMGVIPVLPPERMFTSMADLDAKLAAS